MNPRIIFSVLAGFLIGWFVLAPVGAQEATGEPEATPVVVDENTSITVEDGGTVNIEDTSEQVHPLPLLLNIALVVIIAAIGGGSFAVIWDRIRQNTEAKDTIEKLAEGLSPTWKTTIDRILDVAEQVNKTAGEVLQFARDVTDGVPNTLPPVEPLASGETPPPVEPPTG